MRRDKKDVMKTSINLAQRERHAADLGVVVPTAVVLAVLIALFCKFGVIDQLNRVSQTDAQTAQAQQLLNVTRKKTAGYQSLKDRYEAGASAQAVLGAADPMSCLTLVEENLMDDAAVSSFAISGGAISVKMSHVTLNRISLIYTRLKASPLVSGVRVYTAQTGEKNAGEVTATMTIQLAGADSRGAAS